MKSIIKEEDNRISVTLEGELDTASAQEAEQDFKKLQDVKNKEITIDCKDLNYISSSGLRMMLSLLKSCKPNGNSLVLENLNDNIKKIFTMTGFSSLFNIK